MEVLAPKNHLGPYTRWTGLAGTLKMAGQMGFGEDCHDVFWLQLGLS